MDILDRLGETYAPPQVYQLPPREGASGDSMAAAMLDDSRKLTLANLASPLPAEFDPSRCARSGTGKNKPDKHARHGTAMSFCRLYVPNAYLETSSRTPSTTGSGVAEISPSWATLPRHPSSSSQTLQPDVPPDRTGTVATADVSQYAT